MIDLGLAILVFSLLLALVALLQPLAQRLGLPHSVLLAGLGIGLGAVSLLVRANDGFSVLAGIDVLSLGSDAIVYLFLPVLLFQTGLTIDVRRMIDDIAPILLLAVVAVLVSTAAVGLALAAVSDVGLVVCLMLGAIVATTDPVAVVGIFRELGAPRRLQILIEGESLFNDAAAIAAFSVLFAMVAGGGPADWQSGAVGFVLVFAGGIAGS